MGKKLCAACEKEAIISKILGICKNCLEKNFDKLKPYFELQHAEIRSAFGFPKEAPKSSDGLLCNFCINECRIPKGGYGLCGVRKNDGETMADGVKRGYLSYYFDPLPTNCVAEFCCSASKENFSRARREAFNLAVFYTACNFSCLFCQNWHYRRELKRTNPITPKELANAINDKTYCICYFGGDPTCQIVHSIIASREAMKIKPNIKICWETNGSMNPQLLQSILDIALETGGCVKFDLKAYTESLHIALCGISNKRTLENFKLVASRFAIRKDPPLIVASTPLVSGYVEQSEVKKIAQFIASLNPDIPYSLLVFHPDFYMNDLPITPREVALECYEIAKQCGLKRVNLGNVHLI